MCSLQTRERYCQRWDISFGNEEFESESIKLNFDTIFLDELVEDICRDFYVAAQSRNIELRYYKKTGEDYKITGDRDKIRQVFINLISNALKFTKEKGMVSVSLYANNKNIIAEVKDDGIGIKKEDMPFIFERFYRGDKSRNQTEGSGIGFTIVRDILQIHNVDMEVESEEGKGTTFRILFEKITNNQA